jgi:very-long-chain enoyl-CoA reductase
MKRDIPMQSDKKIKITFTNRDGKEYFSEEVSANETIHNVKRLVWANRGLSQERQYITYAAPGADKPVVLKEKHKTLGDYGITSPVSLIVKDLGAQVSWRTVFVTEYFGPILIFVIAFLIALSQGIKITFLQKVAFGLVLIHYLKREYETLHVHVFSNDTMPLKRIFINSAHYWILCGLFISTELFFYWTNPGYSDLTIEILAGFFLVFEFLNFMTHVTLSKLRNTGEYIKEDNKEEFNVDLAAARTARGIPKGWGFDFVSCANYFWEICIWTTFAVLVRCWTAYLFLTVSALQMTQWALQKQSRYRKEFTGENGAPKFPRGRKAIIPFIL